MRLIRTSWIAGTMICLLVVLGVLEPIASTATSASCVPSGAPSPAAVVLNEILPLPASDWNGDGAVDAGDSFVEILNRGAAPSSVSGWSVSDGTKTFSIPRGSGSSLSPGARLILFGSVLGSSFLSPTGGYVALLDSSGMVVDDRHYLAASANLSFARLPDGSQTWLTAPPSPGQPNVVTAAPTPNLAPTDTPTPTATASPTAAENATSSPTPTASPTTGASAFGTPTSTTTTQTATPSATPTQTPTATPIGPSSGASLNEIVASPSADWNGDGAVDLGDQAIEITGTSATTTNLGGWSLATNLGQEYTLPRGLSVAKGRYLALYEAQTRLLLAASGGRVQLRDVAGNLVDEVTYEPTSPGTSWGRIPDATGPWQHHGASPGGQNLVALPTPTPDPLATPTPTPSATPFVATPVGGAGTHLQLGQVLSNPSARDWDGDGTISSGDQFITVVNPTGGAIDAAGYQLRDGAGATFVFPRGVHIVPTSSLTVFASQTLLTLNPAGDAVALLGPDGSLLDQVRFGSIPFDMAIARNVDGSWRLINPAPPPPSLATPAPTQLPKGVGPAVDPASSESSASRSPRPSSLRTVLSATRSRVATHHVRLLHSLPHLALVTIEGQVTYPAGLLLGARAMVLQQDSSAALVRTTFDLPSLPLNQIVSVTGRVYRSDEGIAVVATLPDDVLSEELGAPVLALDAPLEVSQDASSSTFGISTKPEAPGASSPTSEGLLVRIKGKIADRRPHAWNVDLGGRRVSVEGPTLGETEPSSHEKVSIEGVLIYRVTAPGGVNPRFAPFSSLLRRAGEYVLLVRGAFDIHLAPSPTPTPTQMPNLTPSDNASQPGRRELPSDQGHVPGRWPHVGEGGGRESVAMPYDPKAFTMPFANRQAAGNVNPGFDGSRTSQNRSAGSSLAIENPPHRTQGSGGGQAPALRYETADGGRKGRAIEDRSPRRKVADRLCSRSLGRWKKFLSNTIVPFSRRTAWYDPPP